ncbi:uncharacterized protein V1510DRAFT_420232 [Dipodascopsis tothii]|uniref:uncharacterized protein n=1 Tax=Dipodascopsis tothii TaxID=44089 RepID=UPI0034CE5B1B
MPDSYIVLQAAEKMFPNVSPAKQKYSIGSFFKAPYRRLALTVQKSKHREDFDSYFVDYEIDLSKSPFPESYGCSCSSSCVCSYASPTIASPTTTVSSPSISEERYPPLLSRQFSRSLEVSAKAAKRSIASLSKIARNERTSNEALTDPSDPDFASINSDRVGTVSECGGAVGSGFAIYDEEVDNDSELKSSVCESQHDRTLEDLTNTPNRRDYIRETFYKKTSITDEQQYQTRRRISMRINSVVIEPNSNLKVTGSPEILITPPEDDDEASSIISTSSDDILFDRSLLSVRTPWHTTSCSKNLDCEETDFSEFRYYFK